VQSAVQLRAGGAAMRRWTSPHATLSAGHVPDQYPHPPLSPPPPPTLTLTPHSLSAMPLEHPEGPAPEHLSSNVMNYLVWRYLQESGTTAITT
jgi:hypothetical protein